MHRTVGCLLLVALTLSGCASLIAPDVKSEAAALREGAYKLDPDHAAVLFKIDHLGFSTYVGRFNTVAATLDFDPDNPGAAQLDAVIKTASIDVNNDEFAGTLAGPRWFDSGEHPEAVFRSRSVEISGDSTGRVHGDLTLRGVTRPMTLDVAFRGGANNILTRKYTVGFEATGVLKRSEFGIDNLIPAVGDEVTLEIHAEFLRD